jgi:serine/threonine-protein kinase RsbW
MVIPIGDETELIAVHAVEEVARRAEFPAKAINQIKTALVEACINAAEHSLSPDAKIYLKFASFEDRLVLTVSNRGLRLGDKVRETSPDAEISIDTRRGWGLGLMRNLMDDVRVESVDDGTRIVMTKHRPIG